MPDAAVKLTRAIRTMLPAVLIYLLLFFPNPNEFSDLFEAEKNSGTISLSADGALFLTLFVYIPALVMLFWNEALHFFRTVCARSIPKGACLSPGTVVPPKMRPTGDKMAKNAACAGRQAFFFMLDVFFTLAGLFVIGIGVSNFSGAFDVPVQSQQIITADNDFSALLAVAVMLCAGAVLEEVFFRRYLIAVCEEAGAGIVAASFISLLLFTLPHVWEGIFGMVNALLAGLYLTAVYLQNRTLPAPALAHSLYNITAFLAFI
jgi:membrane protease YdiL (CAAX protease family)